MRLLIPGSAERPITFAQLKPKLMNLVTNALQVETDPQNTHMLLGGLFLSVQDSAVYEKVEQVTQPLVDVSPNLLSSGKYLLMYMQHEFTSFFITSYALSYFSYIFFVDKLLYFVACVASDTASTVSMASSSDHPSVSSDYSGATEICDVLPSGM